MGALVDLCVDRILRRRWGPLSPLGSYEGTVARAARLRVLLFECS